jgi:flagellin
MKNMEVFWNETAKRFDFRGKSAEEMLHVTYNATVLQVGANEKEELMIAFADAGSRALGLSNILLLNNKLSERAITIIDTAIDRVSSMRSSLGAYTNRLEHTISNLTVAHENLTSSESRIRDLDMAKELMRLAKLTILANSGNSMLMQANQLPQGILSLIK